MRRLLPLVLAALAGVVAGGVTMVALQAPASVPPAPPVSSQVASGTDRPGEAALPSLRPHPAGADDAADLVLVWISGGLPDGFAAGVRDLPGVEDVTVVAGGNLELIASASGDGKPVDVLDAGWAIPLDALAIDPAQYARFLPASDRDAVSELVDGQVLLGDTSAMLRSLHPGDTLTVAGGREFTVQAVVDDTLVGAAEVVVTRTDAAALGIDTDRFLLVVHQTERTQLEGAIRQLTGSEVRVRGPGETPFLRHGDAVLPQSHVKRAFGEFAYRRQLSAQSAPTVAFAQDPEWAAANLVTLDLPIIGPARCHRSIGNQLAGALRELADRQLGHLVDPGQFAGCHAPRLISPDAGPSRHSWGIAIDLNADENPFGSPPAQDLRLVETFARWGFTWGGFWLVPDAMHFEYVGPPEPDAAKVTVP